MSKVILPLIALSLFLPIAAYIFYVEFFVVPGILSKEFGQLATLIHLLGTLFLMLVSLGGGAWLSQRTVFKVQEMLVTPHLNHLASAIEKVVMGQWMLDATVQKNVFATGARLGFNIRDEVFVPDETKILEGIERMALPEPQQIPGQGQEVVSEMDNYLAKRKERLSV